MLSGQHFKSMTPHPRELKPFCHPQKAPVTFTSSLASPHPLCPMGPTTVLLTQLWPSAEPGSPSLWHEFHGIS